MMEKLPHISFAQPWFLLGLLLIPAFYWLALRRHERVRVQWLVPSLPAGFPFQESWLGKLAWIPSLLRALVLTCLVVVFARPQGNLGLIESSKEVVDIQLVMDVSVSMLAKDFKPDRLEAAKLIAADFVRKRKDDRIGLVIFSGEAFTQCPITTDHSVLLSLMEKVSVHSDLKGGTAIGLGLAKAISRLRYSEAKSKVVVLLTDGVNNMGQIAPLMAAQMARTFGIRVHTIGVGKQGMALSPVDLDGFGNIRFGMAPVEIDEALLKDMATQTGGQYFRATNQASLDRIFNEIDRLEKTRIEITEYQKKPDLFWPVLLVAFLLFALEWLLRLTLWNSLSL